MREIAHALWPALVGRSKDYIANPKANGYQSLHSAVLVPSVLVDLSDLGQGEAEAGVAVELQIRTSAMHARAESGQAAHAAYKGGLDAAQMQHLRLWTGALQQTTGLLCVEPLQGGELVTVDVEVGDAAVQLFRCV